MEVTLSLTTLPLPQLQLLAAQSVASSYLRSYFQSLEFAYVNCVFSRSIRPSPLNLSLCQNVSLLTAIVSILRRLNAVCHIVLVRSTEAFVCFVQFCALTLYDLVILTSDLWTLKVSHEID